MAKDNLRPIFVFMNYFIGFVIGIVALQLFFQKGSRAPLYIIIAIIIAGPVEEILMRMVKPEDRWLVDQITSILFLIFLLLATLESAKC